MAASPLAAAMLSGEGAGNPGAFLDPAIAAAQPDLQLGQALIQGGLSTAPASPWQALARIAQTGAGSYLQRGAISDLTKAYAHSAEDAAATLPDRHPLRAALQSNDPVIRMQALQAYQKALTLMSEAKNISGGEQMVYGNGAPVFSSNQPISPEGKLQADVNRFNGQPTVPGAPGAAIAPVPRPAGVPLGVPPVIPAAVRPGPPAGVPLGPPQMGGIESVTGMEPASPSFADRFGAAARPSVKPTSPPTSPLQGAIDVSAAKAAAEEAAKNPALIARAGGIAAAENPALIARAGATEAAKNPALVERAGGVKQAESNVEYGDLLRPQQPIKKGPGGTEPLTTTHGTLVPGLVEQAPLPQSPAALKEAVPAWQKTTNEWNASIQPGYQAEQKLTTMANAYKIVQTGYGTEQKAKVNAMLKSAGLPELLPNANAAEAEKAIHENVLETMKDLKQAFPRATQMEFKMVAANNANPNLQPEANMQLLGEDIARLRQGRDLAQDWNEARRQGWRDPNSFEQSWMKMNKLGAYVDQAKKDIGPLKGMPGNEAGAKATAGAKTAATSGTWTDPQTNKTYQIINGVLHE